MPIRTKHSNDSVDDIFEKHPSTKYTNSCTYTETWKKIEEEVENKRHAENTGDTKKSTVVRETTVYAERSINIVVEGIKNKYKTLKSKTTGVVNKLKTKMGSKKDLVSEAEVTV